MAMREIEEKLIAWGATLCKEVDVGRLYSRNNVTHKWKAPFRSLELRETISWSTHDLLKQSLFLADAQHILGARILLRSALESVAILIYLNQITRNVLAGILNFHAFSNKTCTLLLGSRDGSTIHQALNIMTVIEKCNSKYPGIKDLYAQLSESAHPNYEGICEGYTIVDSDNFVSRYSNNWSTLYGAKHIDCMNLCVNTFYHEYNEEWVSAFENLEIWVEENDEVLEATKNDI